MSLQEQRSIAQVSKDLLVTGLTMVLAVALACPAWGNLDAAVPPKGAGTSEPAKPRFESLPFSSCIKAACPELVRFGVLSEDLQFNLTPADKAEVQGIKEEALKKFDEIKSRFLANSKKLKAERNLLMAEDPQVEDLLLKSQSLKTNFRWTLLTVYTELARYVDSGTFLNGGARPGSGFDPTMLDLSFIKDPKNKSKFLRVLQSLKGKSEQEFELQTANMNKKTYIAKRFPEKSFREGLDLFIKELIAKQKIVLSKYPELKSTFHVLSLARFVEKPPTTEIELAELMDIGKWTLTSSIMATDPEFSDLSFISDDDLVSIAKKGLATNKGGEKNLALQLSVEGMEADANDEITFEHCRKMIEYGQHTFVGSEGKKRLLDNQIEVQSKLKKLVQEKFSKSTAEEILPSLTNPDLFITPPTYADFTSSILGSMEVLSQDRENDLKAIVQDPSAVRELVAKDWPMKFLSTPLVPKRPSISDQVIASLKLNKISNPEELRKKVYEAVREQLSDSPTRCDMDVRAHSDWVDHSKTLFDEIVLSGATARLPNDYQKGVIAHELFHQTSRKIKYGKNVSDESRGSYIQTMECLREMHPTDVVRAGFDSRNFFLEEDFGDLGANALLKDQENNWACAFLTLKVGQNRLTSGVHSQYDLGPNSHLDSHSSFLFRVLHTALTRLKPEELKECRKELAAENQFFPKEVCNLGMKPPTK